MIALHSVSKRFRRKRDAVLNQVSCVFHAGTHTAILGHRGCGKTTLLRLLCGMELPTLGHVERKMSVSLPVGYNGRVPAKSTVKQMLDFAARVHSVDADELAAFVLNAANLTVDPKLPLSKLLASDRRRMSYILSYALPFDCYLFDESVGPRSRADGEIFGRLYEMRRESAATILASSSTHNIRTFCEGGANLYLLYNGQLVNCPNADEAIHEFGRLPDPGHHAYGQDEDGT